MQATKDSCDKVACLSHISSYVISNSPILWDAEYVGEAIPFVQDSKVAPSCVWSQK